MNQHSEKVEKKTTIGLAIACVIALSVAAYSMPSYADYCKESQARCDLNKEHSLLNIIKILRNK